MQAGFFNCRGVGVTTGGVISSGNQVGRCVVPGFDNRLKHRGGYCDGDSRSFRLSKQCNGGSTVKWVTTSEPSYRNILATFCIMFFIAWICNQSQAA
jgi:hypothetical protein